MNVSIRVRLTIWYAVLVAAILAVLATGVFFGASWGLRKAADEELRSGIDGVVAFLHHKLAIHEMNDLNDELREHSALMPRGKMFRVTDASGAIIYQPDAMRDVPDLVAIGGQLLKENVLVGGRSIRTLSRVSVVGPYTFRIQVAVDQTEYRELMTWLAWLLILSIPFAGILAATAGYWMSGKALSPIDKITETANLIDARSLSRRLPVFDTNDELDRLSLTMNRMLDRIAASYDRISQFTADASHELRTPVTLIHSNAELLLMAPADTVRVELGLADILAESDYMARLIGDLLTLARSGVEYTDMDRELFELGQSINAVLQRARMQAALKKISVDSIPQEGIVPLFGNQKIVERILAILIDNAVRYTPCGGHIYISTWSSLDTCGFTVHDTGIGIAREDQDRIFERFFRVDTVRTPRDGGSGLGLSIANSLVELQGGSIHVESEIGCGASFIVSFPIADVRRAVSATQTS